MDQLKLFRMIESLAYKFFARIDEREKIVRVTFVVRETAEFVCLWDFDKSFFNNELKILFNSNNSVTGERKAKQ